MKKVILVVLAAMMILSTTACGQSVNNSSQNSQKTGAIETTTTSEKTTEEITTVESTTEPATTAMLENKKVSIPKSLLNNEYSLEISDEDKEKGIISKSEDDDNYYLEISGSSYDKLISEMKSSTKEALDAIADGNTYTSIVGIDYNEDFSEINIQVDNEKYNSNKFDAFSAFTAGITAMLYQKYYYTDDADKYNVVVNIVDISTKEILKTVTYPDALDS